MNVKQHSLLVAGTGIALGLLAIVNVAGATHSWNNASGNPYHWARASNPFTLKLGDNVTSAWDVYLATTTAHWSESSVLNTTIVAGNTNNTKGRYTPKQCAPTLGRGEVCNYRYGANGWLGMATIWASGTHITQGTAKMNDTYFNTASYNTLAWKNLVMCQEVGHIFGLDHQDEKSDNANLGTCMDYTNNPDTNQFPNAHDYEMLEDIYAHLDSPTTVSASTPPGSGRAAEDSNDSDDPRDWGREIRRSADGRASLFEKDFGNGQKVLRHVIWAEPRGNH